MGWGWCCMAACSSEAKSGEETAYPIPPRLPSSTSEVSLARRHRLVCLVHTSVLPGISLHTSGTEHRGSSALGYCFCRHRHFSAWNIYLLIYCLMPTYWIPRLCFPGFLPLSGNPVVIYTAGPWPGSQAGLSVPMQLQHFFRVKYLTGRSIDVNPYGVLLWNAFPVFSFTLVVSHVSFACLTL